MKRAVAIAACGLSLAGCSGMPEMPGFSFLGGSPAATTIQFESEPAGAEAKTSTGQTCRTPCAAAIASNEFSVTFSLNGYQPQTVPVRIAASTEPIDPNTGSPPAPRLVPNPVFVELQPTAAARGQKAGPAEAPATTAGGTATAPCRAAAPPPRRHRRRLPPPLGRRRRRPDNRRLAFLDLAWTPTLNPPNRALSSAGERSLHTGEVVGSIPTAPTILSPWGGPEAATHIATQARHRGTAVAISSSMQRNADIAAPVRKAVPCAGRTMRPPGLAQSWVHYAVWSLFRFEPFSRFIDSPLPNVWWTVCGGVSTTICKEPQSLAMLPLACVRPLVRVQPRRATP